METDGLQKSVEADVAKLDSIILKERRASSFLHTDGVLQSKTTAHMLDVFQILGAKFEMPPIAGEATIGRDEPNGIGDIG
jgi:hypothetical protein